MNVDSSTRDRRIARALVGIAVVPIVVAAVRALVDGWYPVQDDAIASLRALDVLTHNHPWVGAYSSASVASDAPLNHPGPLLFDLLAIPVRINPIAGTAVGVAAINAAAVVGMGVTTFRVGGLRLLAPAMVAAGLLTWTMGSALLVDSWPATVATLPFLCFLTLVWAAVAGRSTVLPWAAAIGSFVAQTHGSYLLLVPGLGLLATIVVVRRSRRGDRLVRRTLVITAVVGLACWAQPVGEQFFGSGAGNLGRLASVGADDGYTGVSLGTRIVAAVVALPPSVARPSLAETLRVPLSERLATGSVPPQAGLHSGVVSVLALLAVAALLAGAAWLAYRRRDRAAFAAVAIAGSALGFAFVSTAALPVTNLGVLPHEVLWLWPIGVFCVFAIATALPPRRSTTTGAAVAVVVVAALALPAYNPQFGPSSLIDAAPSVRNLTSQMGALEGRGTVLFDSRTLHFAEPYSMPVLLELRRRGIRFVTDDVDLVRQVGNGRANDGSATQRIFLEQGDAALAPHAGAQRIAFVQGLDEEEQAEMNSLRDELEQPGSHAAGTAERYEELVRRWDLLTVALFTAPVSP